MTCPTDKSSAMTSQELQKRQERIYAEYAADKLGIAWQIKEFEQPDFIITEGSQRFGLEVAQAFQGTKARGGSKIKEQESYNTKWLKTIRDVFERECNLVLDVRFLGDANPCNKQEITDQLSQISPDGLDQVRWTTLHWGTGKLWIRNATYPRWRFLGNSVGWVPCDASPIQKCIDDKAQKLASYRQHSQLDDSRLLIVRDRLSTSGMFETPENFKPNLKGFDAIYVLDFPGGVRVWSGQVIDIFENGVN